VAIVSGLSGLHPLARMYSARAVKSAEDVTDPKDLTVVAYSWLLRGVYIYSTGEWDEAEKYYRKSMDLFDRLGDRYRWENANTSIGWQNLFLGPIRRGARALPGIRSSPPAATARPRCACGRWQATSRRRSPTAWPAQRR
jgi:hypothetical protein